MVKEQGNPSVKKDGDFQLSLAEASELDECNLKPGSLRASINRGNLPATKFGNTWVIWYSDLVEYLNNRKVGRPIKS